MDSQAFRLLLHRRVRESQAVVEYERERVAIAMDCQDFQGAITYANRMRVHGLRVERYQIKLFLFSNNL